MMSTHVITVLPVMSFASQLELTHKILNLNEDIRCLQGFINTDQAFDYLESCTPDVLYVAMLPRDERIELMMLVHQTLPKLPIVAYSAQADDRNVAYRVGARHFISMPMRPQTLIDTIRAAYSGN